MTAAKEIWVGVHYEGNVVLRVSDVPLPGWTRYVLPEGRTTTNEELLEAYTDGYYGTACPVSGTDGDPHIAGLRSVAAISTPSATAIKDVPHGTCPECGAPMDRSGA
jgi:hypothetical protein